MVALLRAGLASLRGEAGVRKDQLTSAIVGFDRGGMTVLGAVARRHRAAHDGVGEQVCRADDLLRAHHIARPATWADVLAPGLSR